MQLMTDKETSKVINEKCFEFVQQLVMKNPQVLESTTAFGGMYFEWSGQGMQCCVFLRDDLNNSMQCQSQWSTLVKHIQGIIKENQKKNSKLSSCTCDNSGTEMNNFILSWQPLKYDHTSSTVHTLIMWYIDSTSFASEDEDENVVINDGEWRVVNKNFTNGLCTDCKKSIMTKGVTWWWISFINFSMVTLIMDAHTSSSNYLKISQSSI